MTSAILSAQVIHVPGDQPTIQAGIDAANNGDTVLVAENTYYENIRFMGKEITLGSEYIMDGDTNHINNTIIDGSQAIDPDSAACVMFVHDEDTTSILNGFTITGGSGVWTTGFNVRSGGGVFGWEAGAMIINNKIMYNQVESDSAGGTGLVFLGGDNYRVVIDNNTISHNTSISDGYSAFGGGMSILVNAVIKNNIIEHNTCINDNGAADGGGIELELWAGNPNQYAYIYNNIIRYNTLNGITGAIGAGIMSFSVPCELSNNTITYNVATAVDFTSGGGFYLNETGDGIVVIHNNIVNYNSCESENTWGGGARVRVCKTPVITDNEFNNNTLTCTESAIGGGLVINRPVISAVVTGNTMSNNIMNGGYTYGGGCSLYKADTVHVEFGKNIIENNATYYGGGIYIRNTYNTEFTNNIFRGNSASAWGGAINFWHYVDKDSGSPTEGMDDPMPETDFQTGKGVFHPFLANNDFLNNTASNGGAIYSNHEANMPIFLNNIFWGNVASSYNEIYCAQVAEPFTVSTCDIDTDEIRGNWNGHGNFLADPLFIDDSCHLNCSEPSPCINAGDEYVEVDGVMYYAPLTDIDGQERPLEEIFDVGVDEEAICTFLPEEETGEPSLDLTVAPNPNSGALNLRYQISDIRYQKCELFSMDGLLVKTLMSGMQQPGIYELEIDLSNLPDGVYLIRLQSGNSVETAKIILLK